MNLIPFDFDGAAVRVVTIGDEPHFVGKDVCEALGYADATTAMRSHCRGVQKLHPIPDSLGRMQETRLLTEADVLRLIVSSNLPAAERFERWVFEDVLPALRRTGSYSMPGAAPAEPDGVAATVTAAKLFPHLARVARIVGCDRNAAAISANQAVTKLTGTNLLALLGQTHMLAADQSALVFTPTELGKRMDPPQHARAVNMLLAEAGLQMKRDDVWEVTDAGRAFARIFDTGKKHGSGVPIQQVKWSATVLPLLGKSAPATVEG